MQSPVLRQLVQLLHAEFTIRGQPSLPFSDAVP